MSERQSDFKCVIGVIFLLILIFYIIRDLIQLGGCAVACLIVLAAALPARAVLVNNIASIVQVRRDWKQKWLTLLTLLLLKTVLLLLKTMLPNELEAGHVNSITKLLADGDDKVRKWTEDLLNHRMPGRLLGESFSEFLVHLRSTNSGTADASRRLFEQKISAEILAQHFEKIVPPLLADPNLQLWALDLIIAHLAADGYLRLKERSLDLLKEQLPSVIGEDHVDSIMPLLASKDSKVRDWAVHLLNERMPDALFIARFNELLVHLDKGAIRRLFERKISSEILVEHFDQIVPTLLSDPNQESWAVDLITAKMPSRLLGEHFSEFLVHLRSTNSGTADASRRLFEQKISAEILAQHFEKIVPPLLADPKLHLWAFDLITAKMPSRLLGEHFSEFLVHLRSTNSGTSDASRRLFEQRISAEILAQHFEKIVPPLLADPNLQLWALDLIIAHLAADGYLRLKERSLDLLKEQLPSVIGEDHVDSIMPLLASKDSKVRDWAVHLLNERMPDALFIARFNELLVHLDKGAIRRLFERKISSEILVEHFDQIVPLLASSDWQVRLWTVKLLQIRSPTALLVEHQEELVSLLSDPSGQVQRETVSLLERMPNGLICKHYNKLLAPVRSSDPEIRCASRKLLEKQISTEVLEEDFHEIVPPLLADSELQSWSFGILTGRIPPKHHGDLIELIIVLLRREQPWSRQGEALEFLKAQLPEVLGPEHVRKIAAFLNNSECQVKRWTLDLLHEQTPPTALAEHGGRIVMLLDDEDSSVRGTASALVFKIGLSSNMDPSIMGEFAERLAELEQSFSKPFDLPQLMSKLPALLVAATRKEDIASWQDAKGNTWLHLAAEAGHVEACEALVDQVGLPLREKNKAGDEPLALSANREVDRFLRSRIHFRETRFGYGNAFEEMMQDERQVSEVAWYTVPLPGMAGNLGGLHSFLVVTVSGSSGAAGINHGAKRYVLEKAAGSFAKDAHQKHGVFIGSQDLSSNLKSVDGQKQKKQLELRHGSLRVGLKMKELYEEAHSMGPYDVASSNCHHAVQKVFNHCCAREEDKEVRPPNEWLATLGAMFGGLFTSSTSGAGGSNSDVASANSEVASGSHPADRPNGFARSVDLSCDVFAEVAASLSLAVYEKDPAIVLRPQEAGAVSIRNKLGRRVILHDHTTQSRHRVDADRRESLQTAGADKIFVDVDTVGWIPGLCSHRRLARRQAVWSGHAYDLSTDFRNEVVLQEVVSLAPSQAVDVLHTAQKSGSTSPVQWFLARSDNALYVAFRGTDDVQDFAIDVAAVPDYTRFEEHGIGVHSGIAHALEQRGDGIRHVVNDVLRALKEHRQPGERLVLCGHSLGGGYAQVMAVHLLSRELEVAAVRTFGAPHVLVPPSREEDRQKLWCTLDSITQHWVHDWDPVPRLPLCKTWLTDVLPKLKQEVVTGLRVGIAQKYIQALQRHYDETRAKLLERYDIAGEVVLVSKATSVALRASEGSAASKELLGEKPPESVMTRSKLFAYHSMEDYLQIAHKLTAS